MSLDKTQTPESSAAYQLQQFGREQGIKNLRSQLNRKSTQSSPARIAFWTKALVLLEKPFRVNLGVGNNLYFASVEDARPYLQDVFEKTGVVLSIEAVDLRARDGYACDAAERACQ